MTVTNAEMEAMISQLEPLLERKDILGYLAARNTRALRENLTEYVDHKNSLVQKYGKHDVDENGNELPTISIFPGYENWDKYVAEIRDIMVVEQVFTPVTTSYKDALGVLTGQQLLDLDWMFRD